MVVNLIQADTKAVQEILGQMIESAEKVAGGQLYMIHKRERIPGLSGKLREVITPGCIELLRRITDPDDYIQSVPNVRVHQPYDRHSITPFHSDALYGHSSEEVNYWINLTPAYDTNSLWMVGEDKTEFLHDTFRKNQLSLEEFENMARETAEPIQALSPGVHSFCCARVHGSVLNETDVTRVSIDIRALGKGRRPGVKKRGSYFRPHWLVNSESPLSPGVPVTTVASLDEPTPVYLQRMAMERFYSQGPHQELVEFYNVPHHPTLTMAMSQGPVIAYTIRQLKEWSGLKHPIGFVDEGVWFLPGQEELLKRFIHEVL
jgi:hypothetical protein